MTATRTLEENTLDHSAELWAAGLICDLTPEKTLTVGLTSGNRHASDPRSVDGLAHVLHDALSDRYESVRNMLVMRLMGRIGGELGRAANEEATGPSINRSQWGDWSEVTVPIPVGKLASSALEHLPHWIATWKREFGVLLVDLGPICEAPSRVIGRYCDGCYVMLGPDACGSRDWILRHVAWHQNSGSTICGTLVIRHAS